MIKIHLSRILGERKIAQSDLCRLTGIRPGTINAYYHEYVERMNKKDIDLICKALDCAITDLLEFKKD